jgi:hypothetical protein
MMLASSNKTQKRRRCVAKPRTEKEREKPNRKEEEQNVC